MLYLKKEHRGFNEAVHALVSSAWETVGGLAPAIFDVSIARSKMPVTSFEYSLNYLVNPEGLQDRDHEMRGGALV
jgi:hypothetical protein